MIIFEKIIASYNSKLPFAAYKKPNEINISGFFMKDDSLQYTEYFTESGLYLHLLMLMKKRFYFLLKNQIITQNFWF